MQKTGQVLLGNVMIDCGDELALQRFYQQLLGWEACTLYGRPGVRSAGGIVFLFKQEPDYVPPVWPEQDGAQQKQMHFDFQVADLEAAAARALALGARQAPDQFGGPTWITFFDPAGHPFCLCRQA